MNKINELGDKVRLLREEKGLSRPVFAGMSLNYQCVSWCGLKRRISPDDKNTRIYCRTIRNSVLRLDARL